MTMICLGSWSYGSHPPFNIQEALIHAVPGIRDVIGSRNIDGIIWTLEIEVKFYVLCALSAGWLRRSSQARVSSTDWYGSHCAMDRHLLFRNARLLVDTCQGLRERVAVPRLHVHWRRSPLSIQGSHQRRSSKCLDDYARLVVWSDLVQRPYPTTFPIAWSYAMAVGVFAWR